MGFPVDHAEHGPAQAAPDSRTAVRTPCWKAVYNSGSDRRRPTRIIEPVIPLMARNAPIFAEDRAWWCAGGGGLGLSAEYSQQQTVVQPDRGARAVHTRELQDTPRFSRAYR